MHILEFRCPFCGSEASKPAPTVHCANVGCPLNRVDFTEEQWRSRKLEEDLVVEHDRLCDAVNLWQKKCGEYSTRLRELEERLVRQARERREKWMAKQYAAHKERRFGAGR